jgi:geranyl-CoA carboxylase alpha subunit
LQLEIAAGKPLRLRQEDVVFSGCAIEARLCAEDPANGFLPQSGTLALWAPTPSLRVDHALSSGCEVPPFYDSLLAKFVAHGPDRDAARRKLIHGLGETLALGLRTNQDFLIDCLKHPAFAAGEATTAFLETNKAALFAGGGAPEKAAAVRVAAMLSAAPDVGLTHGFPRPVRLKRGEAVHALRVFAGPRGRCRIEGAGEETELTVLSAEGAWFELSENGRRRKAYLVRSDGRVWLRDDGRSFDFEDVSFEPVIKFEAERDGAVRAAMSGRVVSLAVAIGDRVAPGETVLVLEAMKMEHVHIAKVEGVVAAVHVAEGDQVEAHRLVVEIVPT